MSTDDFPFKQDLLYVKGTPPLEYLYIHTNDCDGANFVAYFESLNSDEPTVYELRKVEIPKSTEQLNRLSENTKFHCSDDRYWKKAHMVNTILPGSWNQLFRIVRESIINNHNK